jgi:hypothetical protein
MANSTLNITPETLGIDSFWLPTEQVGNRLQVGDVFSANGFNFRVKKIVDETVCVQPLLDDHEFMVNLPHHSD